METAHESIMKGRTSPNEIAKKKKRLATHIHLDFKAFGPDHAKLDCSDGDSEHKTIQYLGSYLEIELEETKRSRGSTDERCIPHNL